MNISDEDIVRWANEVAELTDDQKGYTAKGSKIAIQARCEGARWMLRKIKESQNSQQSLFGK